MRKKKSMTDIESDVYHVILANPMLSQIEIAHQLNMSRTAVSVHISNLTKKGFILGRSYVIGEYEHAVVIGAAMIDLYGKSFNPLVSSDSNPGKISIHPGGVSRNISENLARMGIKTSLITSLSNDPFSEIIRRSCAEVGINLSHAYENKEDPSTMYVAILDTDGDMNLALSDTTGLDNMPKSHLESKDTILEHADILVVDASLPAHLMEYLVEKYPQQRIVLDPVSIGKSRQLKGLIGKFHTLKCNRMEAAYLADTPINHKEDVVEVVDKLLKKGLKQVFVTMSGDGVYYSNGIEKGFVDTKATKILNVTGAGDAFTAGVVYGMLSNLNMREIAEFASGASALSLKSMLTVNPELSIEKVKEIMKEN